MSGRIAVVVAVVVAGMTVGAGAPAYGEGMSSRNVRLSAATPFQDQCDGQAPTGTMYTNAEVQPHLAVDPGNPRHLVGVWQQDRWSGVGAHGLVTATSFDGGKHWSRSTVPVSRCAGGNADNGGDYWRATDSVVSISPDGSAYVVSLSMNTTKAEGDHAILISRSADGGRNWEAPTTLAHEGTDPGQFVWNDLPWVTADPVDSEYAYVTWGRIVNPPLGGPIYLARSADHGESWQPARPIHDPGENNVAQGVKIVVQPDGALVAFFTLTYFDPVTQVGSTSLNVIRSTDKGDTWSNAVRVADTHPVGTTDPATGAVVRDGSGFVAEIAVGPDGSLHAVWQDGRFSDGVRDGIALSTSTDNGATWSTPARVNPDAALQSFSPAVAVTADGTVGVTYTTLRGGPAAPGTLPADYWIAQSGDGATWSADRVASFDLAAAPRVASPPDALYVGDYHGMVAAGGCFVSIYAKTNANQPTNRTDIVASFTPSG